MITEWMLYSLVVAACAAMAALCVEPLLVARGFPRRLAWSVALTVAIVIPALVAVRPVAVPTVAEAAASWSDGSVVAHAASPQQQWGWHHVLLAGWGMSSLLMFCTLLAGAWRLHRTGRAARPAVVDGVTIAVTDDAGPGARCFGTPRILIPKRLLALDATHRSLLVRHEREHVLARDPQLQVVMLLALTVMPWNAALWAIARRLRTALELDCDARVLAAGGDVRTYGNLLLTVAATSQRPRLATYLAFAAPPSSLERRIRAMTGRRPSPGAWRQLSLGAVSAVAIATACETRRPEPLAPVASYTLADGAATPAIEPPTPAAESTRARLQGEVRAGVAAAAPRGNPADPLLLVYDSEGTLVLARRFGSRDAAGRPAIDSIPFATPDIDRVEVVKSAALLPTEAGGGLIRVTLKPGVSSPQARHATPPDPGASTPAVRPAIGSALPSGDMLVLVMASDGRELFRQVMTREDGANSNPPFERIPVAPASIATVDVRKPPMPGAATSPTELRITLKPGEGLRSDR